MNKPTLKDYEACGSTFAPDLKNAYQAISLICCSHVLCMCTLHDKKEEFPPWDLRKMSDFMEEIPFFSSYILQCTW